MDMAFIFDSLKQNSEKEAIVAGKRRLTYKDLLDTYYDISHKMESIPNNSIVALRADFSAESIASMILLMEKDAIIVPISESIKQPDRYVEIAECEYVVEFDSANNMTLRSTDTAPKHEMLLSLKKKGHPGIVFFSSGTTGDPKAALHDLSVLCEKFAADGKTLKTITFLLFDHIGGFNTMMHAISHAGTIVTAPTRKPEDILSVVESERVELLPTSPTFLNLMLLDEAFKKYDLSSLKIISYGTEPMPESTLKAIAASLPNVKLKQTYGLSELGIMSTKSESSSSLWMKVGGEGFETKIEDGILKVRAKTAMLGYLNAPSPFDNDGWFDTKDKVIEKDGYIKILGRTTDLINVGGEKVYPIEIESCLLEHSWVKDARVYSEDNSLMGKVVVADIQVDHLDDVKDLKRSLRKHAANRLEPYKRPVRYNFTDENLAGERLKKSRK